MPDYGNAGKMFVIQHYRDRLVFLGILGRMRTHHRVVVIIRALLLHKNTNNQHSLLFVCLFV